MTSMWKYGIISHMNYSKGIYAKREWLFEHYTKKNLSLRQIATLCQVDFKTIHYWVRRFKLPRHPIGTKGQTGEKSINWKGGKRKVSGYITVFLNRKCYIGQHRLVAAKCLGRGLKRGEVVHHINLKPDDNRPENLYVFKSQAKHKAYHQALKYGFAKPLKSNLSSMKSNKCQFGGNLVSRKETLYV